MSRKNTFFRLSVLLLAALLPTLTTHAQDTTSTPQSTPQSLRQWEEFDFSKNQVTADQLKNLSWRELKYLRGLVFARHGRIFDEKVIQDYIKALSWYKPNPKYDVSLLNDTERRNMDAIKEAEYRQHHHLEPGDLKFYRTRLIPKNKLRKYSLAELRIMRAEIEAIHGKRFPDETWLQEFFNERYWYQPRANYSPQELTLAERTNMQTLARLEKQQRHLKLAPGMMGEFQNRLVNEQMLRGLGLYELRLLRNEIYARRGQQFRTQWIQEYFTGQSWYRPNARFRESDLSRTETRNIDVIVRHENRLHRELSTKLVSHRLLKDLSIEDARKLRNEIYARRGRRFKDPWLQKYFASFAWYHPNPRFSEASLSAIEKRNAGMIRAYEKQGESLMRQVAA